MIFQRRNRVCEHTWTNRLNRIPSDSSEDLSYSNRCWNYIDIKFPILTHFNFQIRYSLFKPNNKDVKKPHLILTSAMSLLNRFPTFQRSCTVTESTSKFCSSESSLAEKNVWHGTLNQPLFFDILKKTQGPKNSKLKTKTQGLGKL